MPDNAMDHVISVEAAGTLDGLFRERVKRTPEGVAYRDYNQQHANWRDYTWAQIDHQVARWQVALEKDGLKAGDRVGVMLRNSPEWVIFDQAALGLGLVTVPLYTQDRPDNVAYIVNDSGCKVLLFGTNEQWAAFKDVRDQLGGLVRSDAIHIACAFRFSGDRAFVFHDALTLSRTSRRTREWHVAERMARRERGGAGATRHSR